jgi:hypothetical protein
MNNKLSFNKNKKGFSALEITAVILFIGLILVGVTHGKRLVVAAKCNLSALSLKGTENAIIAGVDSESASVGSYDRSKAYKECINPPFLPTNLAGLGLWLDADDSDMVSRSGNLVTSWSDKSDSGLTAVPGSGPDYIVNEINGRAILRFESLEYLTLPGGTLGQGNEEYTITFVAKNRGNSGGAMYFDTSATVNFTSIFMRREIGSANIGWWNSNLYSGTINTSDYYIITTDYDQAGRELFINGISSGSDSATNKNTNGSATVSIGRQHLDVDMDMAEFVYYDRALSPEERGQVEQYLSTKWGISI